MVAVMARFIWLITGVAWAARSLLEFAHPEYYSPRTLLDWTAVWLYSAALLLFAPSLLLLGQFASSRSVMAVAAVGAMGALVAGGANALEDGFGLPIGGTPYVVGFLVAWLSLPALAVTMWRAKLARLAAVCIAMFVGIMLAFGFGGGLIVLGGFAALAIVPTWFARSTAPSPETLVNGSSEFGG